MGEVLKLQEPAKNERVGGHSRTLHCPTGNEFDIAMAVCLHDQHPEVTPVSDEVGNLTGWARRQTARF